VKIIPYIKKDINGMVLKFIIKAGTSAYRFEKGGKRVFMEI
jgi:hypothetical protein